MRKECVIIAEKPELFIRECQKKKRNQIKQDTDAADSLSSRKKLVGFLARNNARGNRRSNVHSRTYKVMTRICEDKEMEELKLVKSEC